MHAAFEWSRVHGPWILATIATAILNSIINISDATWDRWATTRPRLRAAIQIYRKLFPDPRGLPYLLLQLLTARSAAMVPPTSPALRRVAAVYAPPQDFPVVPADDTPLPVTPRETPAAKGVVYSAERRCACGAGLAYREWTGVWICSRVMLDTDTRIDHSAHDGPIALGLVMSERDPFANGATTRPRG